VVLLTGVDFGKSLILLAVVAAAFINWALVRDRNPRAPDLARPGS